MLIESDSLLGPFFCPWTLVPCCVVVPPKTAALHDEVSWRHFHRRECPHLRPYYHPSSPHVAEQVKPGR